MAFAAFGIGVGVRVLSYGLASGGAALVFSQYGTSTKSVKEKLANWLSSKIKPTTAAATTNINGVVGHKDEDSNNKSSCYPSQQQEESQVTKMKEEEIIHEDVKKSPFTIASEELLKDIGVQKEEEEATAEAATNVVSFTVDNINEAKVVEAPLISSPILKVQEEEQCTAAAPLISITHINIKEEEESSLDDVKTSSWMTRMKNLVSAICGRARSDVSRCKGKIMEWCCYLKGPDFWDGVKGRMLRAKNLVSKICVRAKSTVSRWEGEFVEWCFYLKGPDIWDGKKGRILRAILWEAADCLFDALIIKNKQGLRSAALSRAFGRRLYNILKTNFK